MKTSRLALLVGLGIASFSTAPIFAQEAPQEEAVVIVTGTRVAARSALDTAAPVDVVSATQLSQSGVTELNQALSVALPSLNFPRPGLADGTDTIRPATLRGLAPDQTLVLVNSKRRHSSALVNVNGTVGRGSAAVDMNTIPNSIVRSVEVLRDGASAQYGSDAIAGVVNVRLKEESDGGGLSFSYGKRITTVDTLVGAPPAGATWSVADKAKYDRKDGDTLNVSAWVGLPIGSKGFVTIAGEYLRQEHTVRTAPDWRQQYDKIGTAFDPRELTFNRYDTWYGEPDVDQITLFANAGYSLSETAELYGWASAQNRVATSGGFFRRVLSADGRVTPEIYPNGFLPLISPEVDDVSAGGGLKWKLGEWDMDASVVTGYNAMQFTIKNTLNRSYGVNSATAFDAGGFDYSQVVGNLSGVRSYDVGLSSPLNVAVGVEARKEEYSIFAGSRDSWDNGGLLVGGNATASGAQVFPGFRPANETNPTRTSFAGYVDLEANITDKFLVSGAVRAESYEDFGETVTGKLSARYDVSDNFAIRGSVQNGFRAPSLQQIGFTTTSTNFLLDPTDNVVKPFEITTFTPDSAIARTLGAKPLEAEKSLNYALGSVVRFGRLNITVDAYQINIDNRIVLSENLTRTEVKNYLISQGINGVGGGRLFINGVDTETKGVDIIANYNLITDEMGKFNFTFGANFNDTKVTKVPTIPLLATFGYAPTGLFERVNKLTFERGTPKDKFTGSVDWSFGKFGGTLRAIRYGEVLSPGANATVDLILAPKTLIDLEARYKLTDNVKISFGADNITDVYPTKTPAALNGTSNTPFSNLSPFGRSGRYVYGRVAFEW